MYYTTENILGVCGAYIQTGRNLQKPNELIYYQNGNTISRNRPGYPDDFPAEHTGMAS
jgi:hypothetical protein